MKRIILASKSPRRQELMVQAEYKFDVIPAVGEENASIICPESYVQELSLHKAEEVMDKIPKEEIFSGDKVVVIGADTIVVCDHKDGSFEILGKPKDHEDCVRMIGLLQGASHRVLTGVSVLERASDGAEKKKVFYDETFVDVYPMTEQEILHYADSEEPYDKAGAYGIQGKFGVYIKGIRGSYYNVVGLPIARLHRVLKEMDNNE